MYFSCGDIEGLPSTTYGDLFSDQTFGNITTHTHSSINEKSKKQFQNAKKIKSCREF